MAKMKKAQSGDMVSKIKSAAKKADSTVRKTGMNFDKKSFDSLPKMKTKAKSGGEFGMLSVKAGIDKNPNPTQADRIAGAKGMAKSGKKVAKQAAIAIAMKKEGKVPKKMMKAGGTVSMQLGSYDRQIGKNYTGKAKMGKSVGKCKNGC